MAHKKDTKRTRRDGWRGLSVLLDADTFGALAEQAATEERALSTMARVILKRWAEQREDVRRGEV